MCVWVCLILDQYLSPCETLSSQFPPALWESNEWPCRARTESLANGQAVAPPKRGGETFDLRPFTKDKTKIACLGMYLYYPTEVETSLN